MEKIRSFKIYPEKIRGFKIYLEKTRVLKILGLSEENTQGGYSKLKKSAPYIGKSFLPT